MARMGHDSIRAAIIYQHASSEADRAVAAALDEQLQRNKSAAAVGGDEPNKGGGEDDDQGQAGVPAPASKWPVAPVGSGTRRV